MFLSESYEELLATVIINKVRKAFLKLSSFKTEAEIWISVDQDLIQKIYSIFQVWISDDFYYDLFLDKIY